MNRDHIRVGIATGILAATATMGALLAIGARAGAAIRPFNMIAGHLLGVERADAYGFVPSVTLTGIAIHVLLTVSAGVAVAVVARRRFAPAWAAALLVSVLSALVSVGIARRGGASLARLLPIGDLVVVYSTLAFSLLAGTRLAFFERVTERNRRIEPM